MPLIQLTPAQRKDHRADAHHLDPVVMVGGDGLTANVKKEIDAALNAHGLIKVRVFNDDRTKITPCDPGDGFVPMSQVIDALKSGNYRGYLSLEALQKEADPDEVLPAWSKFLKGLIKPEKKD